MIEVEVLHRALAPGAPSRQELALLCGAAAARFGIGDAHVAIEAPRVYSNPRPQATDLRARKTLEGQHRDVGC